MIIIAIDGPVASGKGTISTLIAKELGFDKLDTGIIYRAVGFKAHNLNITNEDDIALIAKNLTKADLEVKELKLDYVGQMASKIAMLPKVRAALLDFQRNFANNPPSKKGAVLDGRDIASVVCPNAHIKIFITASVEQRAKRRHNEMVNNYNLNISYQEILNQLIERDKRDYERSVAPLKIMPESYVLNTDNKTIEQVFSEAMEYIKTKIH